MDAGGSLRLIAVRLVPNYLTRIPRLYRYLAPVYTSMRPLWMGTLSRGVEQYLEKTALPIALYPTTVVLDLGCGPASNLTRLQRLGLPFASYVGFDLTPAMLAARKTPTSPVGDFVQGDAHRLPFADNSFDVVLSTWMFSHLPKPVQVVREAQRLLRSGGWLIIAGFSRPAGLAGALLHLVEPVFLMNCIPPDNFYNWPGLVESKTFLSGINFVARLQKK